MFVSRKKIILLSFLLLPFINGQLQPCEDTASIELKNITKSSDENIVYNLINFPPKFLYSKNVSGEIKTFGCVCKLRNCVRKCCDFGRASYKKKCVPELNTTNDNVVTLNYINTVRRTLQSINLISSYFYSLIGRPCEPMYRETSWFLQEDGSLYIETPHNVPPFMKVGPDKYCIDNYLKEENGKNTTTLEAFVCFGAQEEDPRDYVLSAICMLVSCVFILLTVGVYVWLPKLHNVHGRVLVAYLACLFVGFLLMATMQLLIHYDVETKDACEIMTFIIYFSLLSAFFWLNVMCYDIWRVFSGKREIRPQKMLVWVQMRSYALYAFGVPTVLTILLIILEYSGIPAHPWLPMIRLRGCFLSGATKLFYLYGPILILCVANILLFVLTAVKIAMTRKETSVLSSKESSRHDQQDVNKQTLFLYIKLFILMGISWILEVLSAAYPSKQWRVTDVYNVLVGLVIFIIFVCKRQIFNLLRDRYRQVKAPTSQSMTSFSRTNTTKDETTFNSKNSQKE